MGNIQTVSIFIAGFLLIALASKQIGEFFTRIKLPKITGYLFTGLIAGAFVLGFFPTEAVQRLYFIDEISLAFIAFAAGNELFLPDLKSRFKSIGWVTSGISIVTILLCAPAIYFLADFIPFMRDMSVTSRAAVAILASVILVARSPSSAIAIVNELRAKGPFTQVAIGVTMVSDFVVIVLFAVSVALADVLLTQTNLNIGFLILLIGEVLIALIIAYVVSKVLTGILAIPLNGRVKAGLILLTGYAVFFLSSVLREATHAYLPFEILVEPLLVCMLTGFFITNYSDYRTEFEYILRDTGPVVYIAFFTLTGAALKVDVLVTIWPIALALFGVRLVSIMIGSFAGGVLAGDPMQHNKLKWMGFVTQAGVALGLAKEVSGEFPEFGGAFATMIIAVVVLNEMVGPIFLKYAINRVGEAHPRGEAAPFDGVRDAIIFGLRAQAVTLARQLQRHGWQAKLVCRSKERLQEFAAPDMDIQLVGDLSLATLQKLNAEHADTIVSFLSDEESYQVCALAYEHFGTKTMVVRLKDRGNFNRFHELGVLVVEPQTAVASLLEHFVIAPTGTSILLGADGEQEIVDLEVRNPDLHGIPLRDLRLPLDVLVLSVQRDGHTLVSRGHTQFQLGDKVTMVGPKEKLEEVMLRFDS